jgi:hypothetical protein
MSNERNALAAAAAAAVIVVAICAEASAVTGTPLTQPDLTPQHGSFPNQQPVIVIIPYL